MPKNLSRIKQRGAAIIVALFVTSLVAIAAVAMIERLRMDVRRTELLMNAEKNHLYAAGSIAWAMEQLSNNWKLKKPNKIVDLTPIESPIDQVENASIRSVIYDQEGLFNLNNLSNPANQDSFIRLLQATDPEMNKETALNLTMAIRDWVSAGASKTALDDYYFKQNPPYRAPHRPMVSISELRLIKGVTPELYAALEPNITALPEATKININNAPTIVLRSLSPTLTVEAAQAIEIHRKKMPFQDIKSFNQFDIVKNNPIDENNISLISSYFLVKTSVKVDLQETIIYTLIHREIKNSEPTEIILWQSKGTL